MSITASIQLAKLIEVVEMSCGKTLTFTYVSLKIELSVLTFALTNLKIQLLPLMFTHINLKIAMTALTFTLVVSFTNV